MWTTRIGAWQVQRIEEMLTPGFDPAFLFPSYDPAVLTEHPMLAAPEFFHAETGKLMSSMQSWLLRSGNHVVIVDTGCGNDKIRTNTAFQRFHQLNLPYLERLAALGVRPEDVTMVINTHLHVDHVGWNTRLVDGHWVPTFPNARYLIGRQELAHLAGSGGWPGAASLGRAGDCRQRGPGGERRLGRVDRRWRHHPAWRHRTSGTRAYRWAIGVLAGLRRGAGARSPADVFHQPMQIVRPDWNSCFCELPDVAIATRRKLLAEAADADAVLFPSHTGKPHAGRVARDGAGFRFVPLEMTA